MITTPTAIVLGAGASIEYGFPSGYQLVQRLAIDDRNGSLTGPCAQLIALGYSETKVRAFATALRKSGRQSVDAFLEHRPDLLEVGKAAIAIALIQHEDQFTLFKPPSGGPSLYDHLWSKMNVRPERFAQNSVKFITFNYDRSLEEYFATALSNAYGLGESEVKDLVSGLSINHVHGTLGGHPVFSDSDTRVYRNDTPRFDVELAASSIRIIHEQNADSNDFLNARATLHNVDRVFFLGFGYDATNLERLRVKSIPATTELNGTAFGMPAPEISALQTAFGRGILLGNAHQDAKMFLREIAPLR